MSNTSQGYKILQIDLKEIQVEIDISNFTAFLSGLFPFLRVGRLQKVLNPLIQCGVVRPLMVALQEFFVVDKRTLGATVSKMFGRASVGKLESLYPLGILITANAR